MIHHPPPKKFANPLRLLAALALTTVGLSLLWGRMSPATSPTVGRGLTAAVDTPRTDQGPSDAGASATVGSDARAVAPDVGGRVPLGPEALTVVEVHVHARSVAGSPRIHARAVDERSGCGVASAQAQVRGDGSMTVGRLIVPPDRWLQIEAALDGVHVPGCRVRIGRGETHCVDLYPGAHATRICVRGPSRSLASRLRLEILDRGCEPPRRFRVPLGEHGCVRCALDGTTSAWVVLAADGPQPRLAPLRTRGGAFEFEPAEQVVLEPAAPLVGIEARAGGQRTDSIVWLEHAPPRREPSPCTVLLAKEARQANRLYVAATEVAALPYSLALRGMHFDGDLWALDLERLERLGVVRVSLEGERVPLTGLQAVPRNGGPSARLSGSGLVRSASLPAGDFELQWLDECGEGDAAVAHFRVVAGECTELEIAPRPLETWTVELRGGSPDRSWALGVGERVVGAGRESSVMGSFARPPQVGDAAWVEIVPEKARFAAVFREVDPVGRRAVVTSDLDDAMQMQIRAVALSGRSDAIARWLLPVPGHPNPGGWFFFHGSIHLLPGQVRSGYITESIEGVDHLTSWFDIRGGAEETVLVPSGRWATLVLPRAPARASVVLIRGADRSARIPLLASQRATPLYVAAGTDRIEVEFEGTRRAFDAHLPEFAVR